MAVEKRIQNAALLLAGCPDDIRALGWMVAVHNDYREHGELATFWLFTRRSSLGGMQAVKGEGTCDAAALDSVRAQIGLAPYFMGNWVVEVDRPVLTCTRDHACGMPNSGHCYGWMRVAQPTTTNAAH